MENPVEILKLIITFYIGGMYGLAAHRENDENSARWMDIAAGITNTCHESYDRTDTKLGPEAFRFSNAIEARALKQNERYYILRPETFEAYFIMWRLTHEQKYRDWAWEAIQVWIILLIGRFQAEIIKLSKFLNE